jgi:type VI secretion system protein ImpJ
MQPVVWMRGTFLSPQHLQTQDRFIESALRFQTEALSFRPWGFSNFKIDHEQLSAGNIAIASGNGIFPDGMPFDIPAPDAPPAPKPLVEAYNVDQYEIDVFLAIPDQRIPGMNIALASKKSANTRYFSEVAMLRDENNSAVEKPVQVARKNFKILTSNESLDGYSTIRFARVRRNPTGTFDIDQKFVPPMLDINGTEFLLALTRRLLEILGAKSAQLAAQRKAKGLSLADFGTADIANFWLLYTINSHFPLFQHILEVRRGHPEYLYDAMLSLAGTLTTFSLSIHPRDFPKYDHDNLGECFAKLDEQVRILLDTAVPSNYVSLPLKLMSNSIYATPVAEDRFLRNTRLYLSISSDVKDTDLVGKVPYLIKVCSANHIEHLVRQALPGLPLTHVPKPPSAIPVKLDSQYFSLTQGGPVWEAVVRSRNLAAYVPGDIPNPNMELIILLPEAG